MLGRRSDMIITAGHQRLPARGGAGVGLRARRGRRRGRRHARTISAASRSWPAWCPSHGGMTATQLKAGVEDMLARDKRPLEYFALTELPLTDRGKLSREPAARTGLRRNDPRIRRLG